MYGKIATDPIGAWDQLQGFLKQYVKSAFGSNSSTFEEERQKLLDSPGVFFQDSYIELLPEYKLGKKLADLNESDLPHMSDASRKAFCQVAGASLIPSEFSLFSHQEKMLEKAMGGKHCVVVTGTGSGKTEAFLLPVLASIIREAKSEKNAWADPRTPNPRPWTRKNIPKWDDSRTQSRGEERIPAVRALLLYPMNALVEDQVSRLRAALDSDSAHAAMDIALGGNRIRFGRYNGSTPVAGHPVQFNENNQAESNSSKRNELRKQLKGSIAQFEDLQLRLKVAREEMKAAIHEDDRDKISEAQSALKALEEQCVFVPRMEVGSSEMFHRWEMQASPPDLLITNVSMLSIMLMRNLHPDLDDDRADAMIFDKTKEWLKKDPENHVFQLVIDELHLYRGATGTEVAYLLRQLLDRLGLSPGSSQLRILASSASLDSSTGSTYEFLGGMFGMTADEARQRFHIEDGEMVYSAAPPFDHGQHGFEDDLVQKCLELGNPLEQSGEFPAVADEALDAVAQALANNETIANVVSAFIDRDKQRFVAFPLQDLARYWFPTIARPEDQVSATRGLFMALSRMTKLPVPSGLVLPRMRFHWMVKNINGLWATVGLNGDGKDGKRHVGKLLAEPCMTHKGDRVLEVLYCECCGTQLLTGYKLPIKPGLAELTNLPAVLEGMPDETPESRTDAQSYKSLGVVCLLPENWQNPEHSNLKWEQGSIGQKNYGIPESKANSEWVEAVIDPRTGLVEVGGVVKAGNFRCLWFQVNAAQEDFHVYPAMPQVCPACCINYSERRGGKRSPIRAFATGLTQISLLLTKHLMTALPGDSSRKLVAFSDSRQAAAKLANDIESEQWRHLLQFFILQEIRERAVGLLLSIKQESLRLLKERAIDKGWLENVQNSLDHDEWQNFLEFFQEAKSVVDTPALATEKSIQSVRTTEKQEVGFVRLDDFLSPPSEEQELPVIWKKMAQLGVSPAGPDVCFQRWASFIEFVRDNNGRVNPLLRSTPPLENAERQSLEEMGIEIRKQSWRAISGRLLYDLEAKGFGCFALPLSAEITPPSGVDESSFRDICASVMRLLTEEYCTDPHQYDGTAELWNNSHPNKATSSIKKKRVYNYLQACSELHGTDGETLRETVRQALVNAEALLGDRQTFPALGKGGKTRRQSMDL